MSIQELATLLQMAMEQERGAHYLVVVVDEDEEVYTITDADIIPEQEVIVLRVDTRPLELRSP